MMCCQGIRQVAHRSLGAYREDGNNNPHGAEHSVVDCLPSFLRILDALVVAVKAPVVRLDGARLDDDERQAGWSRWNHHHHVQGRKQNRENISAKGPKKKQTSPKIAASIVTSIPCLCSDPWHPTAPHSSTLAWKMPWTEEPSRLQSMGSRRVGQDRATSLSLFTFMHWRRKWQPTPVFLPGESQGWGSLVGCHLWGRTESDTTEAT